MKIFSIAFQTNAIKYTGEAGKCFFKGSFLSQNASPKARAINGQALFSVAGRGLDFYFYLSVLDFLLFPQALYFLLLFI